MAANPKSRRLARLIRLFTAEDRKWKAWMASRQAAVTALEEEVASKEVSLSEISRALQGSGLTVGTSKQALSGALARNGTVRIPKGRLRGPRG